MVRDGRVQYLFDTIPSHCGLNPILSTKHKMLQASNARA